jgi:hypothetical protein
MSRIRTARQSVDEWDSADVTEDRSGLWRARTSLVSLDCVSASVNSAHELAGSHSQQPLEPMGEMALIAVSGRQ